MGGLPEHMPAAVLKGPGQITVEDVPVPTVGDDEVLVAIDFCGICGTDLHLILEGWATPGSWQGHEWMGTVAAVGSSVSTWKVGDAVVGGPPVRCGECAMCDADRPSLCEHRETPGMMPTQGAFAQYKIADAGELLPVPDGLDPRAAALAEPLAVAIHAVEQGKAQPGQRVLVMGAGPIGALSIAVLRARGIDDVTCAEPGEARRALATRVGATRVVHPEELVVPDIAHPGVIVDDAVDVVLECSGKAIAMQAGLGQLVHGGTMVLVGSGIQPPKLDPNRIILNELIVTGSCEYAHDSYAKGLDLLASGALPVDDLLEPGAVPLDGLVDALRDLAEGRRAGKVLVRP